MRFSIFRCEINRCIGFFQVVSSNLVNQRSSDPDWTMTRDALIRCFRTRCRLVTDAVLLNIKKSKRTKSASWRSSEDDLSSSPKMSEDLDSETWVKFLTMESFRELKYHHKELFWVRRERDKEKYHFNFLILLWFRLQLPLQSGTWLEARHWPGYLGMTQFPLILDPMLISFSDRICSSAESERRDIIDDTLNQQTLSLSTRFLLELLHVKRCFSEEESLVWFCRDGNLLGEGLANHEGKIDHCLWLDRLSGYFVISKTP